ncbi:MAG: tetratricopeptide repeat protein [Acidobacteria bacterium]|nr:tetratricopeptide repeat protein [Acidobacteriota bacterium]
MNQEPPLVGESRILLVDGLVDLFDQVNKTGEPLWVSLEAPSGWGKTRVAREFFGRLATERQTDPYYWPASILESARGSTSGVHDRRKRVFPEVVNRQAGSLPDWFWWGISCSTRRGVPDQALVSDLAQLADHEEALEISWRGLVAFSDRHKERYREWRNAVAHETAMEGMGRLVEVVAGFSPPFLGLGAKMFVWTKKAIDGAHGRRKFLGSETTITPGAERGDVIDDTAALLTRMARPGLPAVLFIEDAHDADAVLVELLNRLMRSDSAILLITTTWPEMLDDASRNISSLLATVTPTRILRVRHDREDSKRLPSGAGLTEIAHSDLGTIVSFYYPKTDHCTVDALVDRYQNPLPLELVCLLPKHQRRFRSGGALEISTTEVAQLPRTVEDLYREHWRQLPSLVQRSLILAAWSIPSSISDDAVLSDNRWHTSTLLEVLEHLNLDDIDDLKETLSTSATFYGWARDVEDVFRRFSEPVQREIALIAGEPTGKHFFEDELIAFRTALAEAAIKEMSSEPVSDAEHSAKLVLALCADGTIKPSAAVVSASLIQMAALRPFPRELQNVIRLGEAAMSAANAADIPSGQNGIMSVREGIASALGESGQVDEAIKQFTTLLKDRQRVLGPDHPDTLTTRNNIAS